MRIVDFIILFYGTFVALVRVDGKPVGYYRDITLPDDIMTRVKKRNEDSFNGYLEQCSIVKFSNVQRGVVNVLAFLDSSWPYSHRQAIMLKMLNERLRKSGLPDTLFFVINANPHFSRNNDKTEDDIEREAWLGVSPDEIENFSEIDMTFDSLANTMNPDIQLIQDNDDLGIWKELGGSRDQVLVIDRCGKLTYQVIVPWSILHFPYVKAAILSTYKDEPCGPCDVIDDTLNELENSDDLSHVTSETTSSMLNDENTVTMSPVVISMKFQSRTNKENIDENILDGMSEAETIVESSTTWLPGSTLNFSFNRDITIVDDPTARNLGYFMEKYDEPTTPDFTIGIAGEPNDTTKIEDDDATTLSGADFIIDKHFAASEPTFTNHDTIESITSTVTEETLDFSTMKTVNFDIKPVQSKMEDSVDSFTDYSTDHVPRVVNYDTTRINEVTSTRRNENSDDRTPDAIMRVPETRDRHFEDKLGVPKMAYTSTQNGVSLDSVTDSIVFDHEDTNFRTTADQEDTSTNDIADHTTMKNILSQEKAKLSTIGEESLRTDDKQIIEELSNDRKENDDYVTSSYMPMIRIIMHAPHFHADADSTRMHEYLVLSTGNSLSHGHLASHDATRLYRGPQDYREGMKNSTIREIVNKEWPMKNLIYNKDESTGLYGEVADYWRDLASHENYEDSNETERPDYDESIDQQGTVDEKLWDQSSKASKEKLSNGGTIVEDDKVVPSEDIKVTTDISEELQADIASYVVTEIQTTRQNEEFNNEEEETRTKLIAHYSKLLPWIYYVLDK